MSKKTPFIMLVGGCAVLALLILLLRESPREQSTKTELPQLTRSSPAVPNARNLLHRYDPSRDPNASHEAARNYYARRESMIRLFHGDRQIDKPLARLKSAQGTVPELLSALGAIRRHETIEGVPYVVSLLSHDDLSIRKSAAEVLCFFGDRRGFDFIIEQRKMSDGFSNWHTLLTKVLTENGLTEYNTELAGIMSEKTGSDMASRVESYELAKLLAKLGDASGVNAIAQVFQKYPPETPDSVMVLAEVNHPLAREIATDLARNGLNDSVRQAALIVLAKQGDEKARNQILEAAKRVTGLPQPQNADGTDKPGMKPKVIGEATPAWDGNAVFALEHGMEVVDPAQAVPVLRDIAIQADNVRFSRTAIELLAKIGDETARNALWEVARSVQAKRRTFEDTLFTTTGKALMLFGDPTSTSLATRMFSGDKHGMEVSQFLAETRGWDGLFKLELFY